MGEFSSKLPLDFSTKKPLEVNFSGLDLSSDVGLLLVRQAEQKIQVCEGIADCLEDNRKPQKRNLEANFCFSWPCFLAHE